MCDIHHPNSHVNRINSPKFIVDGPLADMSPLIKSITKGNYSIVHSIECEEDSK